MAGEEARYNIFDPSKHRPKRAFYLPMPIAEAIRGAAMSGGRLKAPSSGMLSVAIPRAGSILFCGPTGKSPSFLLNSWSR